MGGVMSDAKSNSDLVHNLVESGYLSNAQIKEALSSIDRGRFLSAFENRAYENRSWRSGEDFYLDPSWVFCEVLAALTLKKGDSVLNIASGVGYFGLLACQLVGYQGKFIGVEHNSKTVHYASTRHQNFVERSTSFDMQDFCEPIYLVGDITKFKPGFAKFDKVFCNATVTIDLLPLFLSFLKIGGILIVAIDENLIKCKRLDERRVLLEILSSINMPPLMVDEGTILDLYPKSPVSSELFRECDNTTILEYYIDSLPNMFHDSIEQKMWNTFKDELQPKPNSLKTLCRGRIRNLVRNNFELNHHQLKVEYFARNFMRNYSYELKRIEIMHFGLTNCCFERTNYSQTNITSKLNGKFKDYRKFLQTDSNDDSITDMKTKLCLKCRIVDQMTLIELEDHEYLKSTCEHYRYYLQNRILSLPLPGYLKRFVNYNRIFEINHENFYVNRDVDRTVSYVANT